MNCASLQERIFTHVCTNMTAQMTLGSNMSRRAAFVLLCAFFVSVECGLKIVGIQCKGLTSRDICTMSAKGFHYTDGCNGITCEGDGAGLMTLRLCPPERPADREECDAIRDNARQRKEEFIGSK